jgi:hypothetical protein
LDSSIIEVTSVLTVSSPIGLEPGSDDWGLIGSRRWVTSCKVLRKLLWVSDEGLPGRIAASGGLLATVLKIISALILFTSFQKFINEGCI